MGVKISFGPQDKSLEYLDKIEPGPGKLEFEDIAPEKEVFDPAKKLLQAIFPPKGMPLVNSENWIDYVKHFDVEDSWWSHWVSEEVQGAISIMFSLFQKSDQKSFTMWAKQKLPQDVIDGNFGPVPLQVLSFDQNGDQSIVIMRVGHYTLEIMEWVANTLKKKIEKKVPDVDHTGKVVEPKPGEPGSAEHLAYEEEIQAKDGPFELAKAGKPIASHLPELTVTDEDAEWLAGETGAEKVPYGMPKS